MSGCFLSCGGSDWSYGVLEVGCLLLSHCFGNDILGDLLVTMGFVGGNYQFGSIRGVEESQLEVSLWPETIWAGQMKGPKLVIFLHFSTLLLRLEFSEAFWRLRASPVRCQITG